MKDYSDIGLDSKLRKIGGIAAESREQDSYSIQAMMSGGAITSSQTHTLNFAEAGTVAAGLNQQITGTARTDITGASLSFTLKRPSIVLALADVRFWIYEATAGTGDWGGYTIINTDINGTEDVAGAIRAWGYYSVPDKNSSGCAGEGQYVLTSASMHHLETLGIGSHTIKLQGRIDPQAGTPGLNVYNFSMSYLILGK